MTMNTSRRAFLKSAAALGAATLTVGYSRTGALAATPGDAAFNPFVRISADGEVTAIIKHFEMGQGTSTGLSTQIAEELGVDLNTVTVEFAPADAKTYAHLFYGIQGTGGSTALSNSFMQYRQAGAAAREMLISAAAEAWGVKPSALSIDDGIISGAGNSAPLAEFVSAAAQKIPPEESLLKSPAEFRLIGNPGTSRRDNGPKITGQAIYSMDVHLDGQIVAMIIRAPKFGGKVVSVDASGASEVPGFVNAVALPTMTGVLVYAQDTWSAMQARDAVSVEWDFSEAETRNTGEIKATLTKMVNTAPEFVALEGDGLAGTQAKLEGAAKVIDQEFFFPYLAHASMEPLSCTIESTTDGGVILHDGCQFPSGAQPALAAVLKLPPEKIQIKTLWAGGSFGRRATAHADYHVEAALAFAMSGGKQPVKLVWTREDDTKGGYYRPTMMHKVRVGLDDAGGIVAWDHRIAGPSIFKGTFFEATSVQNGVDRSSVEGVPDTPYALPGQFVGVTDLKSPITVAWLRSVGNNHTAYVMECMMDMAAAEAGVDPIAYRLRYLTGDEPEHHRLRAALSLVAEKSGWGDPLPPGHSRGVATHFSFNTAVAQVAEVSRDADGVIQIESVTCAVDCGLAVNPDVVKAQMEGAIGYGIGLAMRNEITFTEGEVDQSNFPDYEPLRIGDIRSIDVHIVPSTEAPTGVGEPGLPPSAPAVANAIAGLGPRVAALPMAENGVSFA